MDDSPARRQEILLSTVYRLAPQTQSLRDGAVSRSVEKALFSHRQEPLNKTEIQSILEERYDFHLVISELDKVIATLIASQRVKKMLEQDRYVLTEDREKALAREEEEAMARYNRVTKMLFGEHIDLKYYRAAFLEYLAMVFPAIAEEYVKSIRGDVTADSAFSKEFLRSKIDEVHRTYPALSLDTFVRGVARFFETPDPEFDYIKWVLTQSNFLCKALGLDPRGSILSEEALKELTFCLDSNMLIASMLQQDAHHRSLEFFIRKARELGIKLVVLKLTLEETVEWLEVQGDILFKTIDRIPQSCENQISSVFYQEYLAYRKHGKEDIVSQFLRSLKPVEESVADMGIEVVEDPWFDENRGAPEIKQLADDLQKRYLKIRHRPKAASTALRDALMLKWAYEKTRAQAAGQNKLMVATLDTTLPGTFFIGIRSLAIGLDTILQWISPFSKSDTPADFSAIFSNLMRSRFFPEEKIFDLRDFLIFYELDMKTRQLPAKDVEDCLKHIKSVITQCDMSRPDAFKKISYEVARFFADPTREYQKHLKELEQNQFELREEYEAKLGALLNEVKRIERTSNAKVAQIEDNYSHELSVKDSIINDFDRRLKDLEERMRLEKLRSSALARFWIVTVIWTIFEISLGLFTVKYTTGSNWFLKLKDAWWALGLGLLLYPFLGWCIIGKERFSVLAYPIQKIFRAAPRDS